MIDRATSLPGRRRFLAASALALAGLAVPRLARGRGAMVMGSMTEAELYFPPVAGDDWQTVTPEEAGWDAARLEEALDFAGGLNSTAVVVLHRGRILAERYWRGWDRHRAAAIASCQKSITAILTGIAQHQGALRITDRVTDHLGRGWTRATPAQEEAITLRHLLTMTSGLDDRLAFEAAPGGRWYYNTPAYYRVKAVIEKATGASLAGYTRRVLWDRIGMQDSSWVGELLDAPPGQQHRASVRDMARFGLLVLARGRWDGDMIVEDGAYLDDALSTSQDLNPAYGYLWWLNGKASYVLPGRNRRGDGALIDAAPADLVAALGAGDKKIYVVPSLQLVVARHGDAAGETINLEATRSSFDNEWWARLMSAAP